jgi:hypothetical protein
LSITWEDILISWKKNVFIIYWHTHWDFIHLGSISFINRTGTFNLIDDKVSMLKRFAVILIGSHCIDLSDIESTNWAKEVSVCLYSLYLYLLRLTRTRGTSFLMRSIADVTCSPYFSGVSIGMTVSMHEAHWSLLPICKLIIFQSFWKLIPGVNLKAAIEC